MSQNANQPKRFSLVGHEWLGDILEEKPDGEYVRHSDYAALAAENERLRKAGDVLAARVKVQSFYKSDLNIVDAWNAAKEGRDSK